MKRRTLTPGIRPIAGLIAAAVGFSAALLRAEPVVLVEDQIGRCTIVTGADDGQSAAHTLHRRVTTRRVRPSGVLAMAARDLADTLHDMGWVGDPRHEIPVVETVAEARTPYRILLGAAAVETHNLKEEAAALGYPGYVYRTVGNDLLIFGSSSKGTANGVFGFLQDELGVRWFGPQELFRIVPKAETITVSALDRRVEPSFTGRFGISAPLEDPVNPWMRRMRMAEPGDGFEPFIDVGHGLYRVIRVSDYWENHPEYYQMQRGARRLHPGNPKGTNPCWSNPDVIEIAAEAARKHFRGHPLRHSFSIGITDMHAYCECPDCVALQPDRVLEGNLRGGRVASDMYFHFVNEVARRVRPEFPDRYLGLLAYRDVSAPPLGAIEDNVVVSLVLDPSEHYDPAFREAELELIDAWAAKGIPLGMYYYTGLAKLVPAYFPRHLGRTLKMLHRKGFKTLRSESYPGWPWTGPMHYVDARLWWDVTLDVDELLDEYFTALYGPAAPHVAALFALFEEIHMRPRHGNFFYEHYNFEQFRPYTADDLAAMRSLIAAANGALNQLGTDRMGRGNLAERRLAYTTNGLRLFLDMLEGVVLARELEQREAVADDVSALAAIETVDRINALVHRHERVYRESIMLDPYHSNRYHVDTCTPVRTQWQQFLLDTAGDRLIEIHRAAAAGTLADQPLLAQRLRRAIDRYAEHGVAQEAVIRLATGEWELAGPNLVLNPGFEAAEGRHPDYPPHLEWRPSGADQWAYWQRGGKDVGTFAVSDARVRSGTHAGCAAGVGNGTWIGRAPGVVPSEYYYLEAYVNIQAEAEDRTQVRVLLDWLDADAQWFRERVTYRVEGFRQWVRIASIARAPGNAATGAVLLSIHSLPMDGTVFFDDISLRRIAIKEAR